MTPAAVAFSGAVLTGGRSRRMGRDKAVLPIDGVAMADRVASALRAAGARSVVVVGGDPGARSALDAAFVPDRFPGEGPLGGLISALTASTEALVAVCACDLPWLDGASIVAITSGLGAADVAFAHTTRREPLCAVWRRSTCLPALEGVARRRRAGGCRRADQREHAGGRGWRC